MKKLIFVFLAILLLLNIGSVQAGGISISASSSKGGSIQPTGKTALASGASQAYAIAASTGYYLAELKVDGVPVTLTDRSATSYTFSNVIASHRIAAKFAANPIINAKSSKGGATTPSGNTSVAYGGAQSYSIAASTGYHILGVSVDGVARGAISSYDFTNVTSKHSLSAKFAINSYTVSSSLGSNGIITPSTASVNHGGNKTFTVRPNKGYQIATVTVNGTAQTGVTASKYTLALRNITQDTTIVATFTAQTANNVTGLAVGSQVSVVGAQQLTQNAPIAADTANAAFTADNIPLTSDYYKDKTNVYVQEKAGEAFKTVNMILCMIEQTQYSDSQLLNQGFYKAMVNSDVCQGNDSADNSGDSAQAGTSAGSSISYDTWITKSERSSNTSKQLLSAYIHMAKGGPDDQPMTVQAKVEVTEAASDSNPIGIFSMNFKGALDSAPSVTMMKGILKAERSNGNVLIRFAEQQGSDAAPMHIAKAAYTKNDTANTGQGSAYQLENNQQNAKEASFNFAYNANFFKRVDTNTNQGPCLDRNNFETSAWRYALYDASTGKRASVNGGFPVNTAQSGKGYDGYLSYYGLNMPPNAPTLSDGDLVYKRTWENGVQSNTPYTLFIKGGKLKKHSRSLITLSDIKNIPLEGNIPAPGSMGAGSTMYRLTWDGSSLAIRASATTNPSGPPAWAEVSPATNIDSNYTLPFSNLGLYSQALGGQLNIQLSNCAPVQQNNPGSGFICDTPTAATPVVFYKESTVNIGDSVPEVLSCYENCPKASSSAGIDGSSQQTMTYPQDFSPGADNRNDYTFTNMMLRDNSSHFDVVLTSAPAGQSWGFNSGPLFELTQANRDKIVCDWDATQLCGWKAWNALDVFYTWETGPNSWNKFVSVKNANNEFVTFDPPWQAAYTYPIGGSNGVNSSETDAKYSGTKFFLQYSGFGDLQGIPGKCVNPNDPSQVVTDCSQSGFRWVPEFTIPTDSIVSVAGTEYITKPLDIEQRMIKSPGSCTALTPVDLSSQWPNVKTDWVNPGLASEPQISEGPKVIGGVIQ